MPTLRSAADVSRGGAHERIRSPPPARALARAVHSGRQGRAAPHRRTALEPRRTLTRLAELAGLSQRERLGAWGVLPLPLGEAGGCCLSLWERLGGAPSPSGRGLG